MFLPSLHVLLFNYLEVFSVKKTTMDSLQTMGSLQTSLARLLDSHRGI